MLATLLVLLQATIGPGYGNVPVTLAWDGPREPNVFYVVETQQGFTPCFDTQKIVPPNETHCLVWVKPTNVLRVRAEAVALSACPAGTAEERGYCVTPWSNPIWIGPGGAPGQFRVTFSKELGK
jgi:hypothetical protein